MSRVGLFSRGQVFVILLTWLFLHKLGKGFISEKENREKGPVLNMA